MQYGTQFFVAVAGGSRFRGTQFRVAHRSSIARHIADDSAALIALD